MSRLILHCGILFYCFTTANLAGIFPGSGKIETTIYFLQEQVQTLSLIPKLMITFEVNKLLIFLELKNLCGGFRNLHNTPNNGGFRSDHLTLQVFMVSL